MDGPKAAEYRVRYADGSSEAVQLTVGRNIGDWWGGNDLPEAPVACIYTQPGGTRVGLYACTWANPHPEREIGAIDFVSSQAGPVAVCAAITAVR